MNLERTSVPVTRSRSRNGACSASECLAYELGSWSSCAVMTCGRAVLKMKKGGSRCWVHENHSRPLTNSGPIRRTGPHER
jgi:hypothetical protein